jgi:hypothetical protein
VPGTKSSNPPEQGFGTQPIQELIADGTSSSNPLSSSGESPANLADIPDLSV